MQVLTAMAPTMAKREKEAAAKEQVTANQLERTQIVKGISTKWFKGRHDTEMLAQTQAEMDRITQALAAKREKFGQV